MSRAARPYGALKSWITAHSGHERYVNRSQLRADNDHLYAALCDLQGFLLSEKETTILQVLREVRAEVQARQINQRDPEALHHILGED